MRLFLNAIIRISTSTKPDKRLPIGLLLAIADLRMPIFDRNVVHSIGQVGAYIILQPLNDNVCPTFIKALIDIILQYHDLLTFSVVYKSGTSNAVVKIVSILFHVSSEDIVSFYGNPGAKTLLVS